MNVNLPRIDVPIAGGFTIREDWYRFLYELEQRVGGVTGIGTTDLAASQFEDAGIEEIRLGMFKMADEFGQLPPAAQELIEAIQTENHELREAVAALASRVDALEKGTTL